MSSDFFFGPGFLFLWISKTFGSIHNISRFMLGAFRTFFISSDLLDAELSIPFQVRFDTSCPPHGAVGIHAPVPGPSSIPLT